MLHVYTILYFKLKRTKKSIKRDFKILITYEPMGTRSPLLVQYPHSVQLYMVQYLYRTVPYEFVAREFVERSTPYGVPVCQQIKLKK